jgi:biotin transport system ATP-binding protein
VSLAEPRVALVGANGSGKSTLLRCLNALARPTSGRVLLHLPGEDGPPVDPARSPARARAAVGFVFTDPDAQVVMPTPAEDVALSLRRLRLPVAERDARVAEALAHVGLADRADVSVHDLSSGQRQLLAVAAVLATSPRLLVMDEPTTLLDLRNTRLLRRTVDEVEVPVVLATHDLTWLPRATGSSWSTAAGWSPTTPQDRRCGPTGRCWTTREAASARHRPAAVRRPSLVPAHRPGRTALHRAGPGVKLVLLAVAAAVVVGVRTSGHLGTWALLAGGAGLVLALAGHAWVRTPVGVLGGMLRRLLLPLLVLAGYQVVVQGPVRGAEVVLDLVALVLLGGLVTVTTPTDRMLDTVAGVVAPLRLVPGLRPHLHPERVGLTFTLALRSVDVLWDVAAQARDAARARGRGRDVRALVTPTVVRAVAHARATGDALAARGLVD